VRKTKPKLETPFKCYIYCTKGEHLWKTKERVFLDGAYNRLLDDLPDYLLDGKVIGEFVCDRVVQFENDCYAPAFDETADLSCLGFKELYDYLGTKEYGYGWHITDLVIYDKPKELSEFTRFCDGVGGNIGCRGCKYYYTESNESIGFYEECGCDNLRPLKRPPQSWCYCEEVIEVKPLVEGKTIEIPRWRYEE
jgi:hypothetical protein